MEERLEKGRWESHKKSFYLPLHQIEMKLEQTNIYFNQSLQCEKNSIFKLFLLLFLSHSIVVCVLTYGSVIFQLNFSLFSIYIF